MNAAVMDLAAYSGGPSGDCEQSLIGSILVDPSMLGEVEVQRVRPEDFQDVAHRLTYSAILDLQADGSEINPTTLHRELKQRGHEQAVGGTDYLAALMLSVHSAWNAAEYALVVLARAKAGREAQRRREAQDILDGEADWPVKILALLERDDSPVRRRGLDFLMADQLEDVEEEFDDELVEGVLGRGAMAVLYGDSNSGKTFLAIDLAASICRAGEWLGRRTVGGLVIYLASESPDSVAKRLKAYQRHHDVKVPGLVIVRSPINLFDGKADTAAVLKLIQTMERQHGQRAALIIGDTLARLAVGANENSGEDMGVVVQNIDAIRSATGAAFLVIHHTGKDAAKGARGWSGLRAATDTEIEVTCDEATGLRSAEITKQRDLPGKGERLGFKLVPVPLGRNRWGTERGSCVVEPSDAPDRRKPKRRSELAGAIEEFLHQRGSGCLKGALVKHFEGRFVRQSVYRELTNMVEKGELTEVAGVVALLGRPGGPI